MNSHQWQLNDHSYHGTDKFDLKDTTKRSKFYKTVEYTFNAKKFSLPLSIQNEYIIIQRMF